MKISPPKKDKFTTKYYRHVSQYNFLSVRTLQEMKAEPNVAFLQPLKYF